MKSLFRHNVVAGNEVDVGAKPPNDVERSVQPASWSRHSNCTLSNGAFDGMELTTTVREPETPTAATVAPVGMSAGGNDAGTRSRTDSGPEPRAPGGSAFRRLMASLGFREVGTYEKHAQLDGVWRDVVIVERLLPENQR